MRQLQIDCFTSLVIHFTELEETVRKYVNSADVRQNFAWVKVSLASLRDSLDQPTKPMPTLKELLGPILDVELPQEAVSRMSTLLSGPCCQDPEPKPTPEEPKPAEPAPEPAPETPAPTPEPVPVA